MYFYKSQVPLLQSGLLSPTVNIRQSLSASCFHSTSSLNEESFNIGGQTLTVSGIRAVQAIDRSVQHWAVLVDWDLQRQRPYVVVDPFDPQGLLYLSRTEYLSQLKVWASNDLSVMVIARPGSKRPAPLVDPSNSSDNPSQNSPQADSYEYILRRPSGTLGVTVRMTRDKRLTWKEFLDLRKWGLRVFEQKRGLVSVTSTTVARTVYVWGRELLHYAEVKNPGRRLSVFTPIVSHLKILLAHNGQAYTVKRMKIYLFVLYNFVVGNPLETTEPLGIRVRLRNGLPEFLSAAVRGEIRCGEMAIIRVLASIFNLYKAMDAKHPEPDLSTITQPHPDYSNNPTFEQFKYFAREVFPEQVRKQAQKAGVDYGHFSYESAHGLLVRSAGANLTAPSILGMILDAKAWRNQKTNWAKAWFDLHGDEVMSSLLYDSADEVHFCDLKEGEILSPGHSVLKGQASLRATSSLAGLMPFITRIPSFHSYAETSEGDLEPTPQLGRLHYIEEAAGKVRVVAICDYWTQVALKPVHDHLFQILRGLRENDATFDQDGTVMDYYRRGLRPHWSFDLKAATDTIPLALYKEVLKPFLRQEGESMDKAEERVNVWASLLTDRDWAYAPGQTIRYGCGQPMGALSSWASMALTHHALVQFSAWKAKSSTSWFGTYLILGDDVDIATSQRVADSYVDCCATFGVKIGLAKSLHSKTNGFEFANRRFCEKGDISPLSVKEELSCLTWGTRMNFADRILARFGTRSQNETSGWLRKVCTAPQWAALSPELTGYRSQFMLRLVKFCLLNPFYLHTRGKTELNIDSIISWISLLDNRVIEHPGVESIQAKQQLEEKIAKDLLKTLHAECDRLIGSAPAPYSFKSSRYFGNAEEFPEKMLDKVVLKSRPVDTPGSLQLRVANGKYQWVKFTGEMSWDAEVVRIADIPSSCSRSFLYFLECVKQHNQMVKEKLKSLEGYPGGLTTKPLVWNLTEGEAFPSKKYESRLAKIFEWWVELRSLPQYIDLDLDNPIKSLLPEDQATLVPTRKGELKGDRSAKVHERIYGPMREICQVIGRELGVEIPGLPYFNEQLRGKAWTRALRDAVHSYYQNRAAQDASPCMAVETLVVEIPQEVPIVNDNVEPPEAPASEAENPSGFKAVDIWDSKPSYGGW